MQSVVAKSAGFASLAALSFLAGCGDKNAEEAADSKPYVLQTDWYAQPETGGFFHASLQGFYSDEGVNLDVKPSNPQMINAQMVASGQADFGITRIEDILMARARGMPLLAVSVYFQRSPLALMLHESNPANSIPELDEHTVMLQLGKPFHLWMERHFDIKLRAVPHDYGIQRFMADESKEFVQQAYLTNEPYQVEKADIDLKLLPLADAGYQTFLCVYTREEFAAEHPEVVKAVVRASARGWQDYLNGDASATNDLLVELNPVLKPDHVEWGRKQIINYHLVDGDYQWDESFYAIDPSRTRTQFELLRDLEMVPADLDWKAAISNSFLPESLN
ncbi:ABC transporter substrate-binding protein [Pelagicoccus albus]|uniref:Thiamine pyrimidine synthase n=1 Tax=Pelagicoccus albus TaxID=415222 RepID=A0A7X1B935_9BACT|nr:ABC transporter substrate-binding protein [Pelagicoccus albus]MBC2607928.1 ABC transporter substrate-binding protein [Pelagicoccus albus]